MRDLIIKEIEDGEWLDWAFKRGGNNAKSFKTYEAYLLSLSDSELLRTYNRIRDAENNLD